MKPKEELPMGYYLEMEGLFSAKMKMSLKKKWNDFLKKVQSMQKFHAYCQNRLPDLIRNNLWKPRAQYGLHPT